MEWPGNLDELLVALVKEVREPSESVWDWHPMDNGRVSVLLIEDHSIAHARRMLEVGLGGGEGRLLEFQRIAGRWSLVEQGHWVG